MRGTRIYQTIFYLPVVLSLAVIGIIWKLQYAPEQGFINNVLGRTAERQPRSTGWATRSLNLWAALVAASWRHVGYIMVLYLAGLKSVDPALREAAKVDGANERQTFFRVVFPVMAPINVVIVVITTIEALRAFDIAYIINRGKNGLELLSTLITNNSISESNRVGFGSAIAVVLLVISLGPIIAVPDPDHARGATMTARRHGRAAPRGRARTGERRLQPAPGRPLRLPDAHGASRGCSRCCGPSTPSLRPYATRQRNGYISLPHVAELRQLRQRLEQGDFPQLLPQHADRDRPGGDHHPASSRRWSRSPSRASAGGSTCSLLMLFTAGNLLPPQVIIVPLYRLYLLLPHPARR